jgi:hypothetical protein
MLEERQFLANEIGADIGVLLVTGTILPAGTETLPICLPVIF